MAPISTPLVGWDATRSFPPMETSLATTTFWALPPESDDVGISVSLGRISNFSAISLANG